MSKNIDQFIAVKTTALIPYLRTEEGLLLELTSFWGSVLERILVG